MTFIFSQMLWRSIFCRFSPRIAHRCSFSVAASPSAVVDDSPAPSLPSREFMKNNVRRPIDKERLTSAVSEIEMYKEFHGRESIPELSDEQWGSLLAVGYPDERCNFLAALHYDNENGGKGRKDMETVNQKTSKYQLIDLRGQDLRKQMDAMYGSRLWSDQRCQSDNLPRLIVDARFLSTFSAKTQPIFTRSVQDLHDSNWCSPNPFHISIANFRPNAQISELIKRHWFFLHGSTYLVLKKWKNGIADILYHILLGPPSESVNASSFQVNPFSPTLSSRPVKALLSAINKDDIIYVSQKSQKFLPDKPPANIKAVVVCLSGESHHSTSSSTGAIAEGLTPYRIPIEKYLDLSDSKSRFLPICEMASTLRGWFRGEEWSETIKKNIIVRRKRMRSLAHGLTSHSFLAFRSAVIEMNNEKLERKRREEKQEKEKEKRIERRGEKGWRNRGGMRRTNFDEE